MTVVAAQTTLVEESSAVPLARYAYKTGYPECGFWGVYNSNDVVSVCREILTKRERDRIANYLAEAQDEIEQVTGYRLAPTWEADEEHAYSNPVRASWTRTIAAGVRAETTIQAGAIVDMTSDPHVVGPIATTVTDEDEIYVYHPGTDVEINPSAVTIAGGFVTIQIPRCRTVTQAAYAANPGGDDPVDYTIDANFEATVDVKRIYNDTTTQGVLVWTHGQLCTCGNTTCCECDEDTETACIGIRDASIGSLTVLRADYSSGIWTRKSLACSCRLPDKVQLNYLAGMTPLTPQAEDAIIRLAHSKMPEQPCGCSILQELWKRDRNVPGVLTAERLNCDFGLNDGAWIAWQFAHAMRVVRGGTL